MPSNGGGYSYVKRFIGPRAGFMYLGKMVEFGETEPLFNKPKEEMTERYLTGRFG